MRRALTAAGLVGASLMMAVPTASAAAPPDQELCKNGGYANYIDPTTELPFKNQGRCISFVNKGGVLIPVEPDVEEPEQKINLTLTPAAVDEYPDAWTFTRQILATGLTPNGPVKIEHNYVNSTAYRGEGNTVWTETATADAEGNYRATGGPDCYEEELVTVTDLTTGATSGPVSHLESADLCDNAPTITMVNLEDYDDIPNDFRVGYDFAGFPSNASLYLTTWEVGNTGMRGPSVYINEEGSGRFEDWGNCNTEWDKPLMQIEAVYATEESSYNRVRVSTPLPAECLTPTEEG